MINSGKIIIRNDHDELLIILKRFNMKNQNIINFDRHSDLYPNEEIDVGSWGYYGLRDGTIKRFVWIPTLENPLDHIINLWGKVRIFTVRNEAIISVCYDYLIGLGVKNVNYESIDKNISGIIKNIKKFNINVQFVFFARSPQWCQIKYMEYAERRLILAFGKIGFEVNNELSQKFFATGLKK